MPRKQVYGKRSRAIYDPFQAFASPQRPTPNSNIRDQGVFVAEVVEELSRLRLDERKDGSERRHGRKALGEKNVNATVEPVKAEAQSEKTRRRRKVVEEEIENTAAKNTSQTHKSVQKPSHRRHRTPLDKRTEALAAHDEGFVADNVPLFVDGHGYDTEAEQDVSQAQNAQQKHDRSTAKESSQTSGAPSISILPPTPPAEADEYTKHCSDLLALSTHPTITHFTDWANQLTPHFSLTKIAEASFGEVYRLSLLEDLSSFDRSDESVLKVIALKPPKSKLPPPSNKRDRAKALEKSESMSKPSDVANEIKLLQRMTSIPGFTNFRDVRLIQGRPPQPFIKAFKAFNAEQKARKKEPSVFPDPAKKASYDDDQLWAVIEMQDAGVDLERLVEEGKCQSIWTVWDVFWQVVLALAKGEEGAEFEHRDLHLGNVCVRGYSSPVADGAIDTKKKLGFTDLEATVIDYTISRALLSPGAKGDVAFHDLATPSSASIFEGDSTEEYQYDIYRYMRGCVVAGDPYWNPDSLTTTPPSQSAEASPWRPFHPRTNLLWLHHLLHTLLEQLHWPSATKAPPKKLRAGREHAVWKRANDLEHVLLRIQELLDPGCICGMEGLGSAGALVGVALEEGWVGVGDVVGKGGSDGDEVELEGETKEDGRAVGEGDTLAEIRREQFQEVPKVEQAPGRGGRTRRKKQ